LIDADAYVCRDQQLWPQVFAAAAAVSALLLPNVITHCRNEDS